MANLSLFFHAIIALLSSLAIANDHLALMAIKSRITEDPQRVLDTWNTSLHFCQWQGVRCGRRHPRVTRLDLGSRGFVGSLSPHIGNLSFLRVIRLENNTFNGVIPPQVGGLFRLQRLILMNNSFEGEVPASLSNCTSLNQLWLAGNKLVGKLPQQLSSLVNLMILSITANSFSGGIPSFLGNLTSLEFLAGNNNYLEGNIPDVFGQLHSLKVFGFGMNRLHGMIPPSLSNLTSLTAEAYHPLFLIVQSWNTSTWLIVPWKSLNRRFSGEDEAANLNRRFSGEDEARKWKRLEEGIIRLGRIGLACSMESPRERMNTSKIREFVWD